VLDVHAQDAKPRVSSPGTRPMYQNWSVIVHFKHYPGICNQDANPRVSYPGIMPMYQNWSVIDHFKHYPGIYNEDLTFYDTSWAWVFNNIFGFN
jgi:hypothetical protein